MSSHTNTDLNPPAGQFSNSVNFNSLDINNKMNTGVPLLIIIAEKLIRLINSHKTSERRLDPTNTYNLRFLDPTNTYNLGFLDPTNTYELQRSFEGRLDPTNTYNLNESARLRLDPTNTYNLFESINFRLDPTNTYQTMITV